MIKYVGCYNVDDAGEAWDKSTRYRMVIFSKFNQQDEEVERKTIYFLSSRPPEFKTEREIEKFLWNLKNNQKVTIYKEGYIAWN